MPSFATKEKVQLAGAIPATKRTYKSKVLIPPNYRWRCSSYLTGFQAVDLVEAAVHAERIGLPFNRFITIHLEHAKMHRRPQEFISHYLRLIGQWLSKRSIPNTFAWVLEHRFATGEHVHIFLHCPPGLARKFAPKARSRWLRVAGGQACAEAFKSKRIGPPKPHDNEDATASYRRCLEGLLKYILKGLDPVEKSFLDAGRSAHFRRSTAELLGIQTEENEPIQGRRCSRSENISDAARRRWAAARTDNNSMSEGEVR